MGLGRVCSSCAGQRRKGDAIDASRTTYVTDGKS